MQSVTIQCRQQQKADQDVFMMCKTVLSAVHANQSLMCVMDSRTQSIDVLMPLCESSSTARNAIGRHG